MRSRGTGKRVFEDCTEVAHLYLLVAPFYDQFNLAAMRTHWVFFAHIVRNINSLDFWIIRCKSCCKAQKIKEKKKRWRMKSVGYLQVVLAGFAGGIGRGLAESPFEFVKVRRMVDQPWSIRNIYKGSGITILRNAFLFSSFVIYIDLSKQLVENGLGPFWTGAVCGNLAWLTIWPLDVAKVRPIFITANFFLFHCHYFMHAQSQRQSGLYADRSLIYLLKDAAATGKLFRGIVPGLARSTIANGCSMVVYEFVLRHLRGYLKPATAQLDSAMSQDVGTVQAK
jgi:hypothetical protein